MDTIGYRIKLLRSDRGLTLEELAKIVGTSRQTIQRYESGKISNIPAEKIEKIAEALSTTPSALVGWENGDISTHSTPIFNIKTLEDDRALFVNPKSDFCIMMQDDSLLGDRIKKGDMVMFSKTAKPLNSNVVLAVIDGVSYVRRIYTYPDSEKVLLNSSNADFPPVVLTGKEAQKMKILGTATSVVLTIR